MSPLAKTLIFTLLVPGTVGVMIPLSMARSEAELTGIGWLGAVLISVGAAAGGWCAWDFAMTGRGTPAPMDAPKTLVTKGLYRWVRNPMYLGVLLVVAGEAVLYRSAAIARYAAGLWVFFHLFVVFYEEPTLRRKFGQDYEDYRRSVPRWLPRSARR